jgi:hypothetical protein
MGYTMPSPLPRAPLPREGGAPERRTTALAALGPRLRGGAGFPKYETMGVGE